MTQARNLVSLAFFFFFTLVTGRRRSFSLKLSDTRVYEPQIQARLLADVPHDARRDVPDEVPVELSEGPHPNSGPNLDHNLEPNLGPDPNLGPKFDPKLDPNSDEVLRMKYPWNYPKVRTLI